MMTERRSLQLERPAIEETDLANAGDADDELEDLLVEEISIDGMCGVY
jgi:mycofactocin precursor